MDLWSGQRPKCDVLPNPILENEGPAARFLGGIDVHTGRRERLFTMDTHSKRLASIQALAAVEQTLEQHAEAIKRLAERGLSTTRVIGKHLTEAKKNLRSW